MKIQLFLLCYNEELLLPWTLEYYRSRFPDADICLLDNYSTDGSCEIARRSGCRVEQFESGNQQDEHLMIWVRTHMWKKVARDGWVIVCDMDEWLDITAEELEEEDRTGTTILTTQGLNMVGESTRADLSDIVLADLCKGFYDENFSKRVCFKHPDVAMEYWYGAHKCFPSGNIVFSKKTYLLRHFNFLGEAYLIDKHKKRHMRNAGSRHRGLNLHYLDDDVSSAKIYRENLATAITVPPLRRI